MLECIYVTRSDRRGWSLTLNTHFHVYTVSWENNYRCGWLIGSESSSEAEVIAAAVIVTLLEMPHDSPGFPSNSCALPNLENKIPNRTIYLCYKLVLSKSRVKSYHFESLQSLGLAAAACFRAESPALPERIPTWSTFALSHACHMFAQLKKLQTAALGFFSSWT